MAPRHKHVTGCYSTISPAPAWTVQQARFVTPSLQAKMKNLPQGPPSDFAGLYFPVPTSAPRHYPLNAQAHEHDPFTGDRAELTLNARGAGAVIFAPTASLGCLGAACPQRSIYQMVWVPAPLRSAGEEDWAFPGAAETPPSPLNPRACMVSPPWQPCLGTFSFLLHPALAAGTRRFRWFLHGAGQGGERMAVNAPCSPTDKCFSPPSIT